MTPNQITGPNAGGAHRFPSPTPPSARGGQFWRSAMLASRENESQNA